MTEIGCNGCEQYSLYRDDSPVFKVRYSALSAEYLMPVLSVRFFEFQSHTVRLANRINFCLGLIVFGTTIGRGQAPDNVTFASLVGLVLINAAFSDKLKTGGGSGIN